MLLAQWMLRPIHVIQSGLTRLGRGELDVGLDLPGQEFARSRQARSRPSARSLAADRDDALLARRSSTELESVVENLEDAVALFSPEGRAAVQQPRDAGAAAGARRRSVTIGQAVRCSRTTTRSRQLVEQRARRPQVAGAQSRGRSGGDAKPTRRRPNACCSCHADRRREGRLVGVMLVARNLVYLTQVQSTLNYSRKLAALGRLSAGVAHEVKNPLNAMMIHLELLKQKLGAMREPITVPAGPQADEDARSGEARERHCRGNQAARPGRRRVPEVRASRRAEAQPVHLRRSSATCAR